MAVQTIHTNMESVYRSIQGSTPKLNSIEAKVTGLEESNSDPYKVDLSEEAQTLAEESKKEEENTDTGTIDAAIKKIKEQIETVKKQLAHLVNAEGEAEIVQKKMLNEMLGNLNSQLIDLMAQKLEAQG